MSTSIAQALYQLQDIWKSARKKEWILGIWVSPYENMEILNAFLAIEETIYGESSDLFFSFRSAYMGDIKQYEEDLWKEFCSWFQDVEDSKYDMLNALVQDGLMDERFVLNIALPHTLTSILQELERFRFSLNVEEPHFIINFIASNETGAYIEWLNERLLNFEGYEYFRFTAIDIKENRKLIHFSKKNKSRICELDCSEIEGASAVEAAIEDEIRGENPHSPDAEYKQLLLKMLQSLPNKDDVYPFFPKLLQKAKQINNPGLIVSTHIAIAHALNSMKEAQEGLKQIEEALCLLSDDKELEHSYPLWRSCMLFKAAFLLSLKEEEQAFITYEEIATQAIEEKDHLYIMEAYRLCAHLEQREKKNKEAFEYAMLALYAGAYFDDVFRRQSTFLSVAQIALQTVDFTKNAESKRRLLETFLQEYIGSDWQERINTTKLGNELLVESYPPDLDISQ